MTIYSANYGGWEPNRSQPVPVRMFTDADPVPDIVTDWPQTGWARPRMMAKWWKAFPERACPEAEVTVWLDGSVTILEPDFAARCLAELGDDDMLLMRHPWRDCIYDEADASVPNEKYDGQFTREQVAHHREQGHPAHWGLVQTTVLVRRDNDRVRALDAAWWAEMLRWSVQDQLSLPPLLRTTDVRWHFWPEHPIFDVPWLRWGTYNAGPIAPTGQPVDEIVAHHGRRP